MFIPGQGDWPLHHTGFTPNLLHDVVDSQLFSQLLLQQSEVELAQSLPESVHIEARTRGRVEVPEHLQVHLRVTHLLHRLHPVRGQQALKLTTEGVGGGGSQDRTRGVTRAGSSPVYTWTLNDVTALVGQHAIFEERNKL